MSAFGYKRTLWGRPSNVRFTPESRHSDSTALCGPRLPERRCATSGLTDQIDPPPFRHELVFRLVRIFCVVGSLRVVRLFFFARLVILRRIPGVLRLVVQLIAVFFHRRFFVWLIGPWREGERFFFRSERPNVRFWL